MSGTSPGEAGASVVDEIADLLRACSDNDLCDILSNLNGGEQPVGAAAGETGLAGGAPDEVAVQDVEVKENGQTEDAEIRDNVKQCLLAGLESGSLDKALGEIQEAKTKAQAQSEDVEKKDAEIEAKEAAKQCLLAGLESGSLENALRESKEPPSTTAPATCEEAAAAAVFEASLFTEAILARDEEVRRLEEELDGLQGVLTEKDARAEALNAELAAACREVKHRQLDLEYFQLQHEERLRLNRELEVSIKGLTDQIEEARLEERHAEIELEGGGPLSPCAETLRMQGSLSWAMRKGRALPSM